MPGDHHLDRRVEPAHVDRIAGSDSLPARTAAWRGRTPSLLVSGLDRLADLPTDQPDR